MTDVKDGQWRILWTVVSYGDLDGAGRLAESVIDLASDAGVDVTVVVVNNKAGDMADPAPPTRYRTSDFPDNPGYLPAFARIVAGEHSRGVRFDYYVLSNSDLRLGDDFFAAWRSMHFRGRPSHVGQLGPSILQGDGRDMNPYLSAPVEEWRLWFYRMLLTSGLWNLWARSREKSVLSRQASRTEVSRIFAPHGSCLILTRDYFDAGGSLDYPVRLYGEELWLGCELLRIGLRPALTEHLAVFHEGSRTISAQPSRSISSFRRRYLSYWTGREGRQRLRAAAKAYAPPHGDGRP